MPRVSIATSSLDSMRGCASRHYWGGGGGGGGGEWGGGGVGGGVCGVGGVYISDKPASFDSSGNAASVSGRGFQQRAGYWTPHGSVNQR